MIPFLFWIPRAYQVLEYSIEEDSIKMKEGVFWKKNVTIPYLKITNVDITQGPVQRALGIGVIHVQTAGAGGQQGQKAELKINGIKNLDELRDMILEKIKNYHSSKYKEPLRSGEVAKSGEESIMSNNRILSSILKELSAIRQKLEDKTFSQ